MTDRVMPLSLQKYTITKIFNKFNPDGEPYNIDWDGLEKTATFSENLDKRRKMGKGSG